MNDKEKCETILEWATEHPHFDTSFVEKMYDRIEKGMDLTSAQSDALENIMNKWDIE